VGLRFERADTFQSMQAVLNLGQESGYIGYIKVPALPVVDRNTNRRDRNQGPVWDQIDCNQEGAPAHNNCNSTHIICHQPTITPSDPL
jgi:hypothetical protein